MRPKLAGSRWGALQARAQFPEVQEIIRNEISRGTIRVVPAAGGGICIIPTTGHRAFEAPEPFQSPDQSSSKSPTVRGFGTSRGKRDGSE